MAKSLCMFFSGSFVRSGTFRWEVMKNKVDETTHTRIHTDAHKRTQTHKRACFVLGERDDVFVVAVDEFGEPADLVSAHADLIVLPFSTGDVLFERHQAPERQQSRTLANILLSSPSL